MGIIQLGYVGFGVSDLPRWETLMRDVLGLGVSDRGDDGTVYLRMDDYQYRIALHPTGEDDIVYAGWQVTNPRDFAEVAQRLRAAGATVEEGTAEDAAKRKVARLARFTDPSGNPFELFYGPRENPSMPPRLGRAMTGFNAGLLGVGHVVLHVRDRDEAERFCLDGMGLRFTDYGIGRLAFFHCNPRHHSLAVVPVASQRRIAHLMLEVLTLDDVGTAMDLCMEHGFRISTTLGKHSNDQAVSFYVETPSGFEIEYGFAARRVDDATWYMPTYESANPWGHHRVPKPAEEKGSANGAAASVQGAAIAR